MRVGVTVYCSQCGQRKQPRGRSAPMGAAYCDSECPGYNQEPRVGDLWPGETEEDFGYPCSNWGTVDAPVQPEG
jgi:hypothetical protein